MRFFEFFWEVIRDERGIFGIDDLLIGGAIAAAGSVGGAAIGGASSASAQDSANRANAEQAELNRQFQERMSNTAHQREARDLEAAGFNPLLAVKGGASTPSGSMATMEPVNQSGWIGSALEKATGSALSVMQLKKDFEQKDAQIAAQKAGALASVAQANNAEASARATQAMMPQIAAKNLSAMSEAEERKAVADFNKKAAVYDGVASRVMQAVGGVSDAVSMKWMFDGIRRGNKFERYRDQDRERWLNRNNSPTHNYHMDEFIKNYKRGVDY